jgi:hypothetical protein
MKAHNKFPERSTLVVAAAVVAVFVLAWLAARVFAQSIVPTSISFVRSATSSNAIVPKPVLDTAAYDKKLLFLAHVATSSPWHSAFLTGIAPVAATSTHSTGAGQAASSTKAKLPPKPLWPVKRAYPLSGALLPFNRIVAYYGNFYSTGMGVLGEYPREQVLQKLQAATAQWRAADPSTPVIPAIHYIVVTAQGQPGKDGMYRARMPDDQIEKALSMAEEVHGLVFLDFQVGISTVQKELPLYEQYLAMPNVHVGIDPEFSMKDGTPPGREIGTFDASDINWTAQYLASLVKTHDLPPKVLIVHRFTEAMVTNYQKITPLPEVQIVMDMDGWGYPAKKINTYQYIIAPEPVQFTGFKLFYKADLRAPSTRMLTPQEVLSLTPAPSYIQYQ